MTDSLDLKLTPSPDAYFIAVGDETVLLQVRRSIYYGLNPVGTRIWDGLKDGRTPRSVCRDLAEEFGEDLARVEEDARGFVRDLQDHELAIAG